MCNLVLTLCNSEASAIVLRITYGYSIEPDKIDPLVSLIEHMMDNLSKAMLPLAWTVDMLPQLDYLPSWLPGMSFQKTARKWAHVTRLSMDVPYHFVQKQTLNGKFRPSYVSSLLEQNGKKVDGHWSLDPDNEDAIKNSAAIIYGGGADTTVSTISSFILAMILFPGVQDRAQEEIDRVVGSERLPGFQDRDQLPYLNALVKEALRWLPVVPIGTTHVAEEEVMYAGYRIPKGSLLLPSIWWFCHDPSVHPNPFEFEPDRFLEPRNERDPWDHVFGYGRRICPGRYLAHDNLYLTISRILATFHINKAVDKQGNPLHVKVGQTPGLISRPTDFPYNIKARSAKHAELIRASQADYPWEDSDAVHLENYTTDI